MYGQDDPNHDRPHMVLAYLQPEGRSSSRHGSKSNTLYRPGGIITVKVSCCQSGSFRKLQPGSFSAELLRVTLLCNPARPMAAPL